MTDVNETQAVDTEVNPTAEVETTPMVPISEGVSADNNASDDDILDRLMDERDPFEAAVESPEPVSETEVEETVSEDEDTETSSEPMSEEYERAIAALRRDGVPESALENMDDNAILEWGSKRAKVQADVDGYGAKVKELEDKLNNMQSTDSAEETSEVEGQDQPQSQPAGLESLNQYKSQISEIFGDEAAEAVMSPLRDMIQQTAQVLQQQQQAISQLHAENQIRTLDAARSKLQERFPRLSDNSDYQKVVEGMQKLIKIGEYESVEDLMTDSYRISFANLAEQEAKKAEVNRMKNEGQPTTQTNSKTPARSLSGEDREDAALDAILSGGGLDGALSAFNG
tara:strand:+ start:252 stop:1277 length:1026 start_codon:yes stop_codon:yes gene_type:complete